MPHTLAPLPPFDTPFVFSVDGKKSLYFTFNHLQSSMVSAQPTRLTVDYTRTMMGFLLLNAQPARMAMIGLGGGSLLKFCYHHLPQTHFTVVEINPHVIALRHEFEVPEDAARIDLICADGADFVQQPPVLYDVLLVDGFDSAGQAPSLCSQQFYNDAYHSLCEHGIMVVNLHYDDPDYAVFIARIRLAFDGNVLEVPSEEKSNSIVFARRGQPIAVDELRRSDCLQNVNPDIRAQLKQEFARIAWVASDA